MSVIEDLERKVNSLRSQLADAEDSLSNARLENLGLVREETVIVQGEKEYLFTSVNHFSSRKGLLSAYVRGRPRNKNGKWRTYPTYIGYDWKIKP